MSENLKIFYCFKAMDTKQKTSLIFLLLFVYFFTHNNPLKIIFLEGLSTWLC